MILKKKNIGVKDKLLSADLLIKPEHQSLNVFDSFDHCMFYFSEGSLKDLKEMHFVIIYE